MPRRIRARPIHKIPEKTCPVCKRKVNRRKYAEYCPYCAARLYSYAVGRGKKKHTIWVTDEVHISHLSLLARDLIRRQPHMENFDFVDWEKENGAAHNLLDLCEGNQTLASELITAFLDRDTRHECGVYGYMPKSVCTMTSLRSDQLPPLLAYCKKKIGYQRNDIPEEEAPQARHVESF